MPDSVCANSRMPPPTAPPTVEARRRPPRRSREKEFALASDVVSSTTGVPEGGETVVAGICGVCSAGCGVEVVLEQGRIKRLRPRRDHPRGIVCTRGTRAAGGRVLAGPAAVPAAARRRARRGALRARVVGRRLRLPRRAAAGRSRPSTARRRWPSTPGAATSSSASTRRSRRPGRPSRPRTRCCSRSARPTRPASARSASSLTG